MPRLLNVVLIGVCIVLTISTSEAIGSGQEEGSDVDASMKKEENMMEKFDFLLGSWNLESRIPKSQHSEATTGAGTGTFRRALDDKYVYLDYSSSAGEGPEGQAHAVFAWDSKAKVYRFWWFESSGSFMTATCNFVNDETLLLNWHDCLLTQTFRKTGPDKVVLKMEEPNSEGKYVLILEVVFSRK